MNIAPTSSTASIELLRQMAATPVKSELHEANAQVKTQATHQVTTNEQNFAPTFSKTSPSDPAASGVNSAKLIQEAKAVQAAQSAQAAKSTTEPEPTGTKPPLAATAPKAVGAPVRSGFNRLGNLSTQTNFQDFALLNTKQAALNQALAVAQATGQTAAAAVQPALIIQLGMLQQLYSWSRQIEQRKLNEQQNTTPSALASSDEEGAEVGISQLVCLIFFERTLKLVDSCKHLALNRYLKKGPLGEHLHEENTDDEYGTTYADVDAETDYIKRPRHDKPGMDFHYALLS